MLSFPAYLENGINPIEIGTAHIDEVGGCVEITVTDPELIKRLGITTLGYSIEEG